MSGEWKPDTQAQQTAAEVYSKIIQRETIGDLQKANATLTRERDGYMETADAACKELAVANAQLQSARRDGIREGIEAAITTVQTFPDKILVMWERPGGPPGNGYRATTPDDLVAMLRAIDPATVNVVVK